MPLSQPGEETDSRYASQDLCRASYVGDVHSGSHFGTLCIVQVFRELRLRAPDLLPRRMLDFGAGPGTATWAASEVCMLKPAGPDARTKLRMHGCDVLQTSRKATVILGILNPMGVF